VFPDGHFLTPFSEPDVRLSPHPALQGFDSLRFFFAESRMEIG